MATIIEFTRSLPARKTQPPLITRTVPLVDGAVLNLETGQIQEVTGYIQKSRDFVIDPESCTALRVGQVFFYCKQDAAGYLITRYREMAKQFTDAANRIEKEMSA